ncbi:diguanylate cyclase (GGDEF) domain-containing protein [Blastococcus tunisiensis]|uniref:Diguanylate cyclase (GGDEF) domain-containing protein n=2 Tax=Blastococcus tunisiensis TaxID=1798228 RepID=A0A1I2BCH7_9ACTN|nr:diguanylate cyclase (GGDEF) domain-containing protein [Blastococcus sp. DSM 46838]
MSEVATPRTMAATLAVFYAFAGITGLLVVAGADPAGPGREALAGLTLVAVTGAAVVTRWGARWPRSAFHGFVGAGSVLIATAALVSPDTATAMVCGALMSFIAVDAYFFFAHRAAFVHMVAATSAITAALQLRGDVPLFTALAVDSVIVALGVATRSLVVLASRATRDPLTGLTNRRGFDDALPDLMAAASRSGSPLAAVLLDLDHFKEINDADGHQAGDRVLCRVADVWRRALPSTAVFARHGGDEFALLLPGTTGDEALDLVRRTTAGHPGIGLSCGVAEHQPGDSAAQLMRRADHALYMAKAAGRGRAELDGGESSELARDLAAALAAGEVQVHVQPVVEVASGRMTGVEALARWTHPRLGPVPPERFVAVAEQNGLIGALGEHVLRTAVTQLNPLRRAMGGSLGLGINVSGRELTDPAYPQRVRAVLAESGWPASDVVLEVTESLLEAQSSAAVAALHDLRASGLRIAIDDFGTGYSSLSRLDALPVDILKFDSSFVATIATSPRRAQMLESMVGMARALGLSMVAEGVEARDQDAVLGLVGCTYAQGWLYGRPVPPAELVARRGRTFAAVAD